MLTFPDFSISVSKGNASVYEHNSAESSHKKLSHLALDLACCEI
jgi:hypothetical protein